MMTVREALALTAVMLLTAGVLSAQQGPAQPANGGGTAASAHTATPAPAKTSAATESGDPVREPVRDAGASEGRKSSQAQVEFGILAAQKELWREALYRWKRAVDIDPTYAAAYNNLAIAYEHEGQFDEARKAYDKALELDPHNQQIQQNYDLFKEINDRSNRSSTR